MQLNAADDGTSIVKKQNRTAGSMKRLAAAQAQILKISLLVRIASIILLIATSHVQQAFDTSHNLLSYSLDPSTNHGLSAGPFHWLLSFVRWDTIYFLASATPSVGISGSKRLRFSPGLSLSFVYWDT